MNSLTINLFFLLVVACSIYYAQGAPLKNALPNTIQSREPTAEQLTAINIQSNTIKDFMKGVDRTIESYQNVPDETKALTSQVDKEEGDKVNHSDDTAIID